MTKSTTKAKFHLRLKERKSPHFMERHPRYDVLVGDEKVSELYFNMTGFRGSLMSVFGFEVDIGERGISTWKKAVSQLNAEARDVMKMNDEDPRRIEKAERTVVGDLMKLTFDDGSYFCVQERIYRAAVEIFGQDRLSPAFFEPEEDNVAIYPHATIRTGETWDQPLFVLEVFDTEDPDQVAVVSGRLPALLGKIIYGYTTHPNLPDEWGRADLAERFGDDWHQSAEQVVFLRRETVEEIARLNGRDFIRSSLLPGRGIASEPVRIFSEKITSTSDRPTLILSNDQAEKYAEFLQDRGLTSEVRKPEACEEPDF